MKIINKNKKINWKYDVIEKLEAGIILTGSEIKSIYLGNVSLENSYITINNYEIYIINLNIMTYKFTTNFIINQLRKRKLLLKYHEIIKFQMKSKTQKLIIIPTLIYLNNNNKAKIEIALVRNKNKYDKRLIIKNKYFNKQIKYLK